MTATPQLAFGKLYAQLDCGEPVDVRTFHVDEAVSQLFEVQLEVVSNNPDIDLSQVVGRPAGFSMSEVTAGGQQRSWSGVCRGIEQVEAEGSEFGLSTYKMTIVPELWFLTQRRNYRIFQQRSEPQIVLAVLAEWSIEVESLLQLGDYPSREYRVQYGESDYAFICRMLEDAGITFYFQHDNGRTRLVLSDDPTRHEPLAPRRFISHPTNAMEEVVNEVRVVRRVRPGRYTQRDIDHRRAPDFPVVASRAEGLAVESRLERFHYTPGAFLFEQAEGQQTPVADDRGVHRADIERGAEQVQRRLDAKRGSGRIVQFRGYGLGLSPGAIMSITGHLRSDLGAERPLLIVSASHQGQATGHWLHHFEARFADTPFRPALVTPKPRAQGIESATVVGPAGEEIHVDELGRVRVHFHWDRESQMDQRSSCWVPVSQPWGGTGYGAVNIPRIGQEVIVDFLGGDPDRPVIVGRVYTSLQKVPYNLPANKTQSGWKSYSSPSTGGYNELMFEDAAGREVLRVQAERNLSSLVKNDASWVVQNDSTTQIGRHESTSVGADQRLRVGRNRTEVVDGDHVRVVKGDLMQKSLKRMIHSSDELMLLDSKEMITLRVGRSFISLQPDNIIIQGDEVFINPTDTGPSPIEFMLEAAQQVSTQFSGNP